MLYSELLHAASASLERQQDEPGWTLENPGTMYTESKGGKSYLDVPAEGLGLI